jgi:hypothetical protein
VDSPTITNQMLSLKTNDACVAQVGVGFIKIDWVKHICPQIFGFTQDLIQSGH